MNHNEHAGHEHMNNADECCGAGCCSDEACSGGARVGYILQWVLLGGAFVFSLLTLVMLPSIVRKAVTHDQALKAGGMENYERLSKEIYETQDYKDMMKSQVEMFIQQNKATIQMYKNQAANAGATETNTGATITTGETK